MHPHIPSKVCLNTQSNTTRIETLPIERHDEKHGGLNTQSNTTRIETIRKHRQRCFHQRFEYPIQYNKD